MTEEGKISLRRRMIEDMSVRHFASKTQHDYIRAVVNLARFLGRSPDSATNEDLRRFQLHLTESRAGVPIINSTVSALRFFFTVTLDRADAARHLTVVHQPRKLPVVLSPEEVARLLEAAPGVKYKAALSVAYGAGLRACEVVSLKVSDVDSKRMMLRVERGKGGKDRHAMLSPQLLELLRDWWRLARPQSWLFPGQNPVNPMSTRQLNRACHAAAQMAEIDKRVSMHTLRHTHRVAISNSRLIACDGHSVTFKYKDYRADGHARQKVMRLATGEFIRRFLIHVLPKGFHRMRHYGLFASGVRAGNIARARALLAASPPCDQDKRATERDEAEPRVLDHPCPCCGGRMIIIERFERGCASRRSSASEIRIDTS